MIRQALRPLGRGLRDTLDHLLPFLWMSLSWWLGLFLVVTAPAATLILFRAADPRRLEEHQRLERSEALALVRRWLLPAWPLAIAVAIPVAALVSNIAVYGGSDSAGRWLLPLWVALLLLILTAGGMTASLVAVHDRPVAEALRRGVVMAFARAPVLLPLSMALWFIVAIGGLLAVPAVMFIPPLVAVTMNHATYQVLGVEVGDAMEPTPERRAEERRAEASPFSTN